MTTLSTDERTRTVQPDSRVQAARDLREIEDLATTLQLRAEDRGDDRLMPGGLALVALAPVANLEQFGHKLDTAEQTAQAASYRLGLDLAALWPDVEDEDSWEPPLQTLLFWSEAWRREHDKEFEPGPHRPYPTISTEANFLRWALDWAWANELHWGDFVRDLSRARARLESVLIAGARPVMRGAPCLYDECHGKRLIRTTVPARAKDGSKTWRLTDWHCPRCKRSWTEEQYSRNVFAAVHRAKTAVIEELKFSTDEAAPGWYRYDDWTDEIWCTPELAAQRTGAVPATVRTWLARGQLAEISVIVGRRTRFVRLADVESREQLRAARSARLAQAAKRRSKVGA